MSTVLQADASSTFAARAPAGLYTLCKRDWRSAEFHPSLLQLLSLKDSLARIGLSQRWYESSDTSRRGPLRNDFALAPYRSIIPWREANGGSNDDTNRISCKAASL